MTGAILDRAAVAARLGIHPDSVTRYIHRGQCPTPDGRAGRSPWWHAATIDAWIANRPGRGAGGGRPRGQTTVDILTVRAALSSLTTAAAAAAAELRMQERPNPYWLQRLTAWGTPAPWSAAEIRRGGAEQWADWQLLVDRGGRDMFDRHNGPGPIWDAGLTAATADSVNQAVRAVRDAYAAA